MSEKTVGKSPTYVANPEQPRQNFHQALGKYNQAEGIQRALTLSDKVFGEECKGNFAEQQNNVISGGRPV